MDNNLEAYIAYFDGEPAGKCELFIQDGYAKIEDFDVVKKHQKPNKQHPQGGIIEITKPIAVSKVGFSIDGKPSRIGYKLDDKGKKTRIAKKSGKEIK